MPVPTMLATTMQIAVRSEMVLGLRAVKPVLTGDHLAVAPVLFKRELAARRYAIDAAAAPRNAKGLRRIPQPLASMTMPSQLLRPGTSQRFQRVEFLLLVSREQRANLCVQLLDDRLGRGARLLMDRVKLRLDCGDQRLHLGLLRIGQVEHVVQHRGHIRWTVVVPGFSVAGCLRARQLPESEHGCAGES